MRRNSLAFTILELLVSLTILLLMLGVLLSVVANTTRITSSNPPTFQEARTAFETMNRLLSQAVLNTYWDYDNYQSPQSYIRASELHFVLGNASTLTGSQQTEGSAVFFQAPLGQTTNSKLQDMPGLLNSVGFYSTFSTSEQLPSYLASKQSQSGAWHLWMYLEPTENFSVYTVYSGTPQAASQTTWFTTDLGNASFNHVLANNVILLLLRAHYTDANGNTVLSYAYDSRPPLTGTNQPIEMHQIPPLIETTLVVIDQKTADRLLRASNGSSYNLIPNGLFINATNYASDMAQLQGYLNGRPISGIPVNYQIFQSSIPMNASQWSQY